jgi:hypothetical protein
MQLELKMQFKMPRDCNSSLEKLTILILQGVRIGNIKSLQDFSLLDGAALLAAFTSARCLQVSM